MAIRKCLSKCLDHFIIGKGEVNLAFSLYCNAISCVLVHCKARSMQLQHKLLADECLIFLTEGMNVLTNLMQRNVYLSLRVLRDTELS